MKCFIALKGRVTTLRSYITLIVSSIVALCLVCAGVMFYLRTTSVLTNNYKQSIRQQLGQIHAQIGDQINFIDSINTLFLSNSLIRDSLDPRSSSSEIPYIEKKLPVEKQMGYLLYNTYMWNTKLIDSAYIFDSDGNAYQTGSYKNPARGLELNRQAAASVPSGHPSLSIRTLDGQKDFIFFIRNIYSIYTGDYIATVVIDIDQQAWTRTLSANLDPGWFVYMCGDQMDMLTRQDMWEHAAALPGLVRSQADGSSLKELLLGEEPYFAASRKSEYTDIYSMVAAPKRRLFEDLHQTMEAFLLFVCLVIAAALAAAVLLSRAVVRPIENMIAHVKRISRGEREQMPPLKMYSEFNEYSEAFNHMLKQLDAYYHDSFQKQLLLKNAEIQALQSQMDPHFLFNVLNTIAWKAQMSDQEEIYQMVISLGEMLKRNTVSRETSFITLEEELEYVRFYIYLQKMRFEDKIAVDIQADPELLSCSVPCFCIQPLVENAIAHGLEPKRGMGTLTVSVKRSEDQMEISIADDGVGFAPAGDFAGRGGFAPAGDFAEEEDFAPAGDFAERGYFAPAAHSFDRERLSASDHSACGGDSPKGLGREGGGSHAHIALRNLDKRLYLLFGESARLHINSRPGQGTKVTFRILLHVGQEETGEG